MRLGEQVFLDVLVGLLALLLLLFVLVVVLVVVAVGVTMVGVWALHARQWG